MARILFCIVQNEMAIGAEDRACQAALNRNRDFRQFCRVRAGGGGKVEAWIFFIVQAEWKRLRNPITRLLWQ